jgi:hypothetical protein
MMEITRQFIEEVERYRKQKQNLLALLRGGHVTPKRITKEEAIKRLIADIAECDEAILEAQQEDARLDIECRTRFFT